MSNVDIWKHFHRFNYLVVNLYFLGHCCALLLCVFLTLFSVCRWFETHHQAEAMGPAGGADRQVWVAPWGGWVLCRLPDPHAGADPREESHGCRVPAPPLARPLVETSNHCTSLPSQLSRDCNRSLSSLGISDEYLLFLFFLFCCFWISYVLVIELMLLCMFVFVGSSLGVTTSGIQWIILLFSHAGSNCCAPFTSPN